MKKEIIDFPFATYIDGSTDYFIFQRDSSTEKTTYKTTLDIIKNHLLDNIDMLLVPGEGISTQYDNIQGRWTITNTSRASDIRLIAGSGISISNNDLQWTIDNTSKASDLVLKAGDGISVQKTGNTWTILNTDPAVDMSDFEIIAGENVSVRREGNVWTISAVHLTCYDECVADCGITGDVDGIIINIPCSDITSSIN